ncbi:MAG: hypothetical protein IT381_15460 [Deltaproteobacteria bacterium]|nr:hypothetical protein [Deltaproteobacteria bacterium]
MRRFPREFGDLLTPRGRAVITGKRLHGVLSDPARRFCAERGLLAERHCAAAARLLDQKLWPALTALEAPIPPETIYAQKRNYEELLPKTVRVKTAYLERRREHGFRVAEDLGLVAMLRSESFVAFCTALAGRPLRKRHGIQALCYGAGDYAGPHTDHHPEEPLARDGYVDVHLTLCTPGVAQQWLVYARRGHFSEVVDVTQQGIVTGYRLPFWHYTTPLVVQRAHARRWVLLGTFLFADAP